MRIHITTGLFLCGLAVAACDLEVLNPNDPETERVLGTPNDVESLAGAQYKRWHEGLYTNLGNVNGMAAVQSFENYSALANNCQNQRNPIPRPANNNDIGNTCGGDQRRVYDVMSEVTRTASNVLDRIQADGFSLEASEARRLRAEAIAEFARGLALGYLALIYDSAAVVTQGMGSEDAGELVGYMTVMDSALVGLDRAIAAANASIAAEGSGGFPIPTEWIPTPLPLGGPAFIQLVRSYKARLRANVARDPAERAAVNWAEVISDATNGITADHENVTNRTTGPFYTWVSQWHTFATWHQMPPWVIGMADVSGEYAAWIAQPLGERGNSGAFFMATPDLRFPQGATRPAQQADFAITSCSGASQKCKRYFRNRPTGDDQFQGPGWGWSNYDHVRFRSWAIAGDGGGARNGPLVFMTKAEIDMLAAEGHIRLGQYAQAATLIDRTRTAGMRCRANPSIAPPSCPSSDTSTFATGGGLPALSGVVSDATTPVPGGASCVPKVPVGPGFNTVACGNIMEAMKYEKRIETVQTHFAAWFLDMRGWGDLVEGTPVHWAPPYQDMQARGLPTYSTGGFGVNNPGTAARGTYGW